MASPMGTERVEVSKVREKFGAHLVKVKVDRGETYLCIKREALLDVIEFLKADPELKYDYFSECLGVDYLTWTHERDFSERFEVVYNLMSHERGARIFVKVGANIGDKVSSLIPLFLGAEYPEREIWDMFGIEFAGNEQSQRFLMPDDWIGHPLRKDYPLGGEDVLFDQGSRGPAVEDVQRPHAGESFEGKTGSEDVGGR